MLNNIPAELRELEQWVCATKNKIPINPRTGGPASPTDPATWATFAEAVKTGHPCVGFVLAPWDPYTIIDLDNKPENPATVEQLARHNAIIEACQSYTERSTSRTGYHIIVKGSIPSGVNRDHVEMYSSGRYMICTGDTVANRPIVDCQQILDNMYGQMKPEERVGLEEYDEALSDREIVEMASNASNGFKFDSLCAGDMSEYPSQSEADLALLSILAFYTQSNEQVRRLFRMSALGKREKAQKNDTYINFALGKIRAKQPEPVDFEALKLNAAATLASSSILTPEPKPEPIPEPKAETGVSYDFPPGLLGELTEYIYRTSYSPVRRIALAGALAFLAGIAGRVYNNSTGYGLNQYLVLLAGTGVGKEGAETGIDNLFNLLRQTIPGIDIFQGPGKFASGQGLIRTLEERPSIVSVYGEVGFDMQQMCDPRVRPDAPVKTLRQNMMSMYSKSGNARTFKPISYSDREKNTKIIQSPCLTFLGESTAESFYERMDISHITDGFLPRFDIIEFDGDQPPPNRDRNQQIPERTLCQLIDLATVCLNFTMQNECMPVAEDAAAKEFFTARAEELRLANNRDKGNPLNELWNRAMLKMYKIAALVAVGVNHHNPIVTLEIAKWAELFVTTNTARMVKRFSSGEIGEGRTKQISIVRDIIRKYFQKTYPEGSFDQKLQQNGIIRHSVVSAKVGNLSAFKNDPLEATGALKIVWRELSDCGQVQEISPKEMKAKFGKGGVAYAVTAD